MKNVLIVEDEKDLAELLEFNLKKDGYNVVSVYDGKLGLETALNAPPDLILLDLMLPGMLGTDVCRELRKQTHTARIPIIMITAKGDEIDRVVGFEIGVDDYIVKPFSVREVVLRVKAVMRRIQDETAVLESPKLKLSDIIIDLERHIVTSGGVEIELTSTEFKLLQFLTEKKGVLNSRERLLQNVWGYNSDADTRTVDTHITRLRGKLGSSGELIKTVRGFGYKIEE